MEDAMTLFNVKAPINTTAKPKMKEQENKNNDIKLEDCLMNLGDLSLDEIVGQDDAIKSLKNLVDAIKYKELYKMWNLSPPKGILLTGPPGVGKTASVRALAKELSNDAIVMQLKYTEVASRWIDAPIEKLKNFFSIVESQSESNHVVVFIDEIDAMLPSRDMQIHETSMRRVNVFLEWMDGGFSKLENVTIIGATNLVDAIDKAARRAGRFDKIIDFKELKAPDIVKGFNIHLSKKGLKKFQIEQDIELNLLIPILEDGVIVGSDIPEIINRIVSHKLAEHKNNIENVHKNFQLLEHSDKTKILLDMKYMPEPINIQDFTDEIKAYLQYKYDNKLSSKKQNIGFSFDSQKDFKLIKQETL